MYSTFKCKPRKIKIIKLSLGLPYSVLVLTAEMPISWRGEHQPEHKPHETCLRGSKPIMNLSRFNLPRSFISPIYLSSVKPTRLIYIPNTPSSRPIHSSQSSLPMPPKLPPTDLPTYSFPTPKALETFLEKSHTTTPGFYLKLAKKASGIPSITAPEAVETALCFGWIDGRANTLDENWWLVRYTPRRAKSIWSQKNVATVTRLVSAGRMRPAGLAAVDAAKADGRWERAYAGPASMRVPEDFREVLERVDGAGTVFEGLKRSERYAVLWRVETASPAARKGRIEALVKMLAEGKVPGDSTLASSGKRKGKGEVDEGEVSTRRKSARVAARTK